MSPMQPARAAGSPLKVVGRFLQDANGHDIMMRGVNIPVYKSGYDDDLDAVAAAVATTKTNVVRLEWWANPPVGSLYTVENLDRAIQKYADLGILPIIELHDLTYIYGQDAKPGNPPNSNGNDQTIFANTITSFWTRADVLPILIKHQDHLVINLANEWGSSTYSDATPTTTNFIQNYTAAITAMRNVGINAPIMVDAPKGFEYQFILANGQAILDADPQHNTMFSIHAYWAARAPLGYTDAQVNQILTDIKNSGLPIILGEVSSNAWANSPCDPVNYDNLLTTANTNQIGYLIWAWYEDGTCGADMNMTADGVTIPALASFGYNVLNGANYGINTASPTTTPIATTLTINSKILTAGRAIANWPANIPAGEKRPVLVFLPGWGGTGAVDASIDAQNTLLANQGYVTLAIGFDEISTWISNIDVKTKDGLDLLCGDATIPANCDAITLVGESYGAAQNYWVIEYLRDSGYNGGAAGNAIAFLSEDSGYGAPGTLTDYNTGAYTRSGLANTSAYSVAMIENLGDTTFPVDACTWGNCGARTLSDAHLARGDQNVFSICPASGEHGTRGFANWDAWVVSALKTMIHIKNGIPTFTNYTAPTLTVGNICTSPQERVKNGSFETYKTTSKIPSFWTPAKFTTSDGKSTLYRKFGKASVKITGTGAVKTLTQKPVAVSGVTGAPFTLSYYIKTSSMPTAKLCQVQVLFYNGSSSAGKSLPLKCPKAATWKLVKINFTAPAAYTSAAIKITYTKTSGTVWFDGVSLMR